LFERWCHLVTAICRRHNHLLIVKKTTILAHRSENWFASP
jgi:hypothetical protein